MAGKLLVIVGLGNPGQGYVGTRHNMGIMAVDALAARHELASGGSVNWQNKKDWQAEIATTTVHGIKAVLVKPQTYMNLSGKAVAAVTRFYGVAACDIWIIHDDLDLPLGKIQLRQGGNTAGHHGLESIVEAIGSTEFNRVRLGIRGHELRALHAEQGVDTNQFVTGRLTPAEQSIAQKTVELAAGELLSVLGGRLDNRSQTLAVDGYETL